MAEYKSLYGSNDINADEAYIENLEVNTLKIGRTTIQDLETTISNRQMNIPDSGENGEFVITNGDVDQIIGGDNTFTGVNNFSNPLGLKVDLISEYTLNNGVTIEGVKLKDGEITDTNYTTGVLHSDTNGVITSSSIVNADVSNSAAIAYSKLSLSNSILNDDINTSAAIAYSKLSLSNSIVNADINTAAAIAVSKLASGTASQILLNNDTPTPTWTSVTGDVTISNTGVTAIASGVIVNADVNASAAIAYSKLNLSNSILNADINTSAAIAYSKLNLSNSIVNADINTAAAIAVSKLASGTAAQILLNNSTPTPTWTSVTGDVTISNTGVTAIASGVIVNADVNASAGINISKLEDVAANIVLGRLSTSGPIQQLSLSEASVSDTVVKRDSSANIYANRYILSNGGTLANPCISFQSDGDTGIYSDVANILRFACGGSIIMGLGTSSVSINQPLTVATINNTTLTNTTINNTTLNTTRILNGIGSQTNPSYSFTGDTDTGIYSPTASQINIVCDGFIKMNFTTSNVNVSSGTLVSTDNTLTNISNTSLTSSTSNITTANITSANTTNINNSSTITNSSGTVSAPSYNFGTTNTGFYSSSANVVNVASNGVNRLGINTTGINVVGRINNSSGSASAPSYTFNSDIDTGIYSDAADTLKITTGGTNRMTIDSNGCYSNNFSLDGISYLGGIFKSGPLTLSIGDSSGNSFSSVICTGTYTRMFNIVHYFFSLNWSGKGSTISANQCRITGFPYSFSGSNSITSNIANLPVSYTSYLTIAGINAQTYAGLWNQRTGLTDTFVLVSDMPVTNIFYVQMTAYV